jgi:hypothetical protein
MTERTHSRRRRVVAGVVGAGVVASMGAAYLGRYELKEEWLKYQWRDRGYNAAVMEKALMIAGGNPAEAAQESREAATIAEQFAQARTAPGVVDSGAYGAAYRSVIDLPASGGSWNEVTNTPYNADDPRYRDWNSNSSGGAGYVTGRITGLAADPDGKFVYAAGADGGVWRTGNAEAAATGSGPYWQAQSAAPGWTPIADKLPSMSSGDLELASDSSLWFATGEANTGGTSYVGAGVYRLENPRSGEFDATRDQVGGQELESTTIGRIRPGDGVMFAATNRGIWYHDASSTEQPWTFAFAPNMSWMPRITDDAGNVITPAGSNCSDTVACGATNAGYKNIVNDIAVDPRNPKHVIAAIGWRSGDSYNGFYETSDYTQGPGSWHRVNVQGIKNTSDIGYTTFAFAEDGSKLYAMIQQPSKIASSSSLLGIYVSRNGNPNGQWTKIATSAQLLRSGSALDPNGYSVGVQAWYNQFLTVDPDNADHVWAGLEEVFETTDGGTHWSTPSPYWNFYFPCWSIHDETNSCPLAGHPDQHSVAVGKGFVYFGNDGGVYRRPVDGELNANKNATDLVAINDGTNDGLQYYSVSVGKDTTSGKGGDIVSGGLQDNGVSNLFAVQPDGSNQDPAGRMGSNFGGDGGDGFADPRDGCNQVQEYVYLSASLTNNCALNDGATSEADATSRSIDPGDPNPRFIAPMNLDSGDPDAAIFGGQYVWTADDIWHAEDASALTKVHDNGAGHSSTAVAMANGVGYSSWCGPCNNAGFARGISTNAGTGKWHDLTLPSNFPNRFVQGLWVDPSDGNHAMAAINGFSRRFTEGPGVGLGHLWETKDAGASWTDVSGNLPDVPASTILKTADGVALGTDLGVFYRADGRSDWQRLGGNFPLTVVMKLTASSDGSLVYAATHGRGIWSFDLSQL